MDAKQIFLFDPIPAKAKKLGLLSIYKFSLSYSDRWDHRSAPIESVAISKQGLTVMFYKCPTT
jgi:hypothetical protein